MRSTVRLLCVGAVLGGAVSASAQGVGAGPGRPFHALVLTTGMSAMSVGALNARMAASQFAPLSNDAVSYGVSGYLASGRAMVGAQVARSAFGEEGLNNGRTDALSSVHVLATVAYAVLSTERLTVFPQIGVGVATDVRRGGAGAGIGEPDVRATSRARRRRRRRLPGVARGLVEGRRVGNTCRRTRVT